MRGVGALAWNEIGGEKNHIINISLIRKKYTTRYGCAGGCGCDMGERERERERERLRVGGQMIDEITVRYHKTFFANFLKGL